jgi:hypothetical protein
VAIGHELAAIGHRPLAIGHQKVIAVEIFTPVLMDGFNS